MKNTIKAGLIATLLATQLNAVETTTVILPQPQPQEIIRTTVVAPQQVVPSVLSIVKSGAIGFSLLAATPILALMVSKTYSDFSDSKKDKAIFISCLTGTVAAAVAGVTNIIDMVKKIQLRRQLNKA